MGKRGFGSQALLLLLILFLSSTSACRNQSRGAERLSEDSSAAQELDSSLTFNDITLEQSDDEGRAMWKVDAEQATYSPDQKVAQVINPDGELYQDGEPVFQIQAQRGEVRQDGAKIVLEGDIVATDTKSGAVLRGDQLEWSPADDVLIVRNGLRGTHPQLVASANEARVFSRDRRMELRGNVRATTRDPNLRLNGNHLTWRMDDEVVISDRPIQVERLDGNQTTDRARGDQANVDLESKIVRLQQNAQLLLTDPPLQITSNLLTWNLNNQTVTSEQPVTVVHQQQQITLTANQGRMDLERRIFYLTSNVRAIAQRNQSQIVADSLTWKIPSQQIEAEGNVNYRQTDPPLNLTGPRAVGRLENQTIVVSGGRVVTEIIPPNAP